MHRHTYTPTYIHSRSLSHTQTHSLSLSHTQTHKHTHTHTHTHTQNSRPLFSPSLHLLCYSLAFSFSLFNSRLSSHHYLGLFSLRVLVCVCVFALCVLRAVFVLFCGTGCGKLRVCGYFFVCVCVCVCV